MSNTDQAEVPSLHDPSSLESPTETGTLHGGLIDFMEIDPNRIVWRDICRGLARESRYIGQTYTDHVWTVADHLVTCDLVAEIVAERHGVDDRSLRRAVLLHDVPEYLTRDLPRPLKKALAALGGGPALDALEAALDYAVQLRFDVPSEEVRRHKDLIVEVDMTAYDAEVATIRPPFHHGEDARRTYDRLQEHGFRIPRSLDEDARMARFEKLWKGLFPATILTQPPQKLPVVHTEHFLESPSPASAYRRAVPG